jgi:hypothetical protein
MLSNEHLLALGNLVVEAAALERIVTDVVRELIDDDPAVGTAALQGLQFKQIADRALPLAETRRITLQTGRELEKQLRVGRKAMDRRNTLIHSFWIVEGDDGDPPLQSRLERARITRRERIRVETPEGSKVRYRDTPEQLRRHVEFALEVLPADIDDASRALADASNALLLIWYRIAKELGRSHPDEADPTLESYPNRQYVDLTTIRRSDSRARPRETRGSD